MRVNLALDLHMSEWSLLTRFCKCVVFMFQKKRPLSRASVTKHIASGRKTCLQGVLQPHRAHGCRFESFVKRAIVQIFTKTICCEVNVDCTV